MKSEKITSQFLKRKGFKEIQDNFEFKAEALFKPKYFWYEHPNGVSLKPNKKDPNKFTVVLGKDRDGIVISLPIETKHEVINFLKLQRELNINTIK